MNETMSIIRQVRDFLESRQSAINLSAALLTIVLSLGPILSYFPSFVKMESVAEFLSQNATPFIVGAGFVVIMWGLFRLITARSRGWIRVDDQKIILNIKDAILFLLFFVVLVSGIAWFVWYFVWHVEEKIEPWTPYRPTVSLPDAAINIQILTPTHYDNTHPIVISRETASSLRLRPGEIILFTIKNTYGVDDNLIRCNECKNREPLKGGEYQYSAPMYAGAYEINIIVPSKQGSPVNQKLRVSVEEEESDILKEKAVITSHRENQKVTTPEYLEGECKNIPKGTYLWIVVRPKFTQSYHPQSNRPDHGPMSNGCDGAWEGIAYIGASQQTDINGRFEILLVGVDIKGSTIMRNYLIKAHHTNRWHGFRQLPEGARIYQKITVIRR
uniref:Uncharacterized protein n=1 Tax=Candidatus Kentrum sp. UNK TaxID=2126344 RepID=A0A451AQG7_9GAMM|nr:MAG: hypothetical protein BECKUNK1418G_GA0071005_10025 [Candidatus Kentron sp. UNK]VFK68242.1 MAG: hypothetical protein BECKUNK1418H_GA0071006_10015 [Candidatus Kentron sp. UNK]